MNLMPLMIDLDFKNSLKDFMKLTDRVTSIHLWEQLLTLGTMATMAVQQGR